MCNNGDNKYFLEYFFSHDNRNEIREYDFFLSVCNAELVFSFILIVYLVTKKRRTQQFCVI